jgi:hypothetical protein
MLKTEFGDNEPIASEIANDVSNAFASQSAPCAYVFLKRTKVWGKKDCIRLSMKSSHPEVR